MTNEQHIEEILIEAHNLGILSEVFESVSKIIKESPTVSIVDAYEISLKNAKINKNGIISNTPS